MKRVIATILCLMVVSTCLPTLAAAAKPDAVAEKLAYAAVDKANEKIEKKTEKAVAKATEENDAALAAKLVEQTEKIAGQANKKAEKNDAVLACDYEEVTVGDEVVLIDPLRVIWFKR